MRDIHTFVTDQVKYLLSDVPKLLNKLRDKAGKQEKKQSRIKEDKMGGSLRSDRLAFRPIS